MWSSFLFVVVLGASSKDITIRHLFSRWTRHCPFSVGLCKTCKLLAPTFSLDGLPGFWSACQLCSIILFNNFVQQKLGTAFCCSSPIKSTWDLSPPPYHRLGKHISSCGQHRYGLFFVHYFFWRGMLSWRLHFSAFCWVFSHFQWQRAGGPWWDLSRLILPCMTYISPHRCWVVEIHTDSGLELDIPFSWPIVFSVLGCLIRV